MSQTKENRQGYAWGMAQGSPSRAILAGTAYFQASGNYCNGLPCIRWPLLPLPGRLLGLYKACLMVLSHHCPIHFPCNRGTGMVGYSPLSALPVETPTGG